MYGLPHSYNPFGPHAGSTGSGVSGTGSINPKPSTLSPALLAAAERAGATHLSGDGQRIYCERFGAILEAEWDGAMFGVWWPCEGLPSGAVILDAQKEA